VLKRRENGFDLEKFVCFDEEVEKDYIENGDMDIEIVKKCINNGHLQGYLFQCLSCGQYRLYVDCT
jgi:uncharacterized protein CbrC (UPF0167 family)